MALARRRRRSASGPDGPSAGRRPGRAAHGGGRKKWSQHVTQVSNPLDLEANVFKFRSPTAVAASLKRSALHSRRRMVTVSVRGIDA